VYGNCSVHSTGSHFPITWVGEDGVRNPYVKGSLADPSLRGVRRHSTIFAANVASKSAGEADRRARIPGVGQPGPTPQEPAGLPEAEISVGIVKV
jgi:hypothetical protein